jgi:hypothetical protein
MLLYNGSISNLVSHQGGGAKASSSDVKAIPILTTQNFYINAAPSNANVCLYIGYTFLGLLSFYIIQYLDSLLLHKLHKLPSVI